MTRFETERLRAEALMGVGAAIQAQGQLLVDVLTEAEARAWTEAQLDQVEALLRRGAINAEGLAADLRALARRVGTSPFSNPSRLQSAASNPQLATSGSPGDLTPGRASQPSPTNERRSNHERRADHEQRG